MIIARYWYKFVFQTTHILDMVNVQFFEVHMNRNSVYGQFQHEFIQFWFALIIHPDRRNSVQFACLALNFNRQCVQPNFLYFVLLVSKFDKIPFNQMVIKPCFHSLQRYQLMDEKYLPYRVSLQRGNCDKDK